MELPSQTAAIHTRSCRIDARLQREWEGSLESLLKASGFDLARPFKIIEDKEHGGVVVTQQVLVFPPEE